jgi:glycosyltransferase involved in cell wall biosynthesis
MQLTYDYKIPSVRREPSDMLSILIDARKIKHGGIGVYLKNLIAGVSNFDDVKITALVYPESRQDVLELGAKEVIEVNTKLYSWDELFNLKKIVDFKKFDLFHTPHFTLPFGVPIPTVVTIHDTIHLSNPEKWYYPFLIKRFIKSALKRADKILTVSEASKRNLEKLYSKINSNIEVIPNAVDPIFMIGQEVDVAKYSEGNEENFTPERDSYCLAVLSNQKPHKGIPDLIKAFDGLKNQIKSGAFSQPIGEKINSLKLVLVGQGVESVKGSDKFGPDVQVKGKVSVGELRALYQKAQCLIVPSLAEGFCLPVIEAQSCGTPVVSRPVPAVLELMTTNDIVAADFSVASLTNALFEFFVKRLSRTESVDYGVPLAHMQRFDRKAICEQIIKVYRSIAPCKQQKIIN